MNTTIKKPPMPNPEAAPPSPARPPVLYWFPQKLDVPPAHRNRFLDAAGRLTITKAVNAPGPDRDVRGCLAAPYPGVPIGYDPKKQRWSRMAPDAWIGVPRDLRPAELARARQVPSVPVKLADGNIWYIPVANPFSDQCALPTWDVLDENGEWTRELQDAYADLGRRAADLAAKLRAALLQDLHNPTLDVPDAELRTLIADALAVNYHVDVHILSAARVFSNQVYWGAVEAVIDWGGVQRAITAEIQEVAAAQPPFPRGDSQTPDTSATPTGSADSAPATIPPASTSSTSTSTDSADSATPTPSPPRPADSATGPDPAPESIPSTESTSADPPPPTKTGA